MARGPRPPLQPRPRLPRLPNLLRASASSGTRPARSPLALAPSSQLLSSTAWLTRRLRITEGLAFPRRSPPSPADAEGPHQRAFPVVGETGFEPATARP